MADERRDDAADSSITRVGFIGLGRMGRPMAQHLVQADYRVAVHTRTAARATELIQAGAIWASTPAQAAESAELVITCLDSLSATESVLTGDGGILAGADPGLIVVDHGTIAPAAARRLGSRAAAAGVDFLDAPVSGGPEGAAAGTLTIMAGGSPGGFARVTPVLQTYGRLVVHVGEIGSGSSLKLVNQVLTFVHGAVAAEALAFARREGLPMDRVEAVLSQSFGQSRMLERAMARLAVGNLEAGAALRLYQKDLGYVLNVDAASDARAQLPLTNAAVAVLERALGAGLGERDITALSLLYRDTPRGAGGSTR